MRREQVKRTRKLNLSEFETKVFNLIKKHQPIMSIVIAEIVFKNSQSKPKSISNSVTSAIRQINRKLERVGEPMRIVGECRGRGGKSLKIQSNP